MGWRGFRMAYRPKRSRAREWLDRIKRFLKRETESPEDPYAYVGAPKKPRPPYRRRAAAEPLD